jgi:hypothetical protein
MDDHAGTKTYSAPMSTAAPSPPGAVLLDSAPPAGPDALSLQWLRRLHRLAQQVQRLDARIDTLRDSLQSFETSLQALRTPHLRAVAHAARLLAQLQRLTRCLLAPPAAKALPQPTVWGRVTHSVNLPRSPAARRRETAAPDAARRPQRPPAAHPAAKANQAPARAGLMRCDLNALPRGQLPGWEAPASEPAEDLHGSPSSRAQALKRLYRSLARRFHPDLVATAASKQRCEAQMAAINALYSRGDLERLMLLNCATTDPREALTALPQLPLQTLKERYRWLVSLRLRLLAELRTLQAAPLAEQYDACHRGSLEQLRQKYAAELAQGDTAVLRALENLQAAAATYNRKHSLCLSRQDEPSAQHHAKATGPDPKHFPAASQRQAGPPPMHRTGPAGPERRHHLAAVQRRIAWLNHLAQVHPIGCRLVLLTYVNHCAAQPLVGLETHADISQRLVPAHCTPATPHPLAAALRELQDVVTYGVCQQSTRRVRLGLRFADPHAAEATAQALQQGAVAAEFARLLPALGPRLVCAVCAAINHAVPLYTLAGLEPLSALCCPNCGRCLQRYRQLLGVDLQALFNTAYVQHGWVVSCQVQVGTLTVTCQWAACLKPRLRLYHLKRRLQRHLFAANGLRLSLAQLRLTHAGGTVPDTLPLQAAELHSLRLTLVKTSGLSTRRAVQQVQHAIGQRFAPGPLHDAIPLH